MEFKECIHIFMTSAITIFPSLFLVHKLRNSTKLGFVSVAFSGVSWTGYNC